MRCLSSLGKVSDNNQKPQIPISILVPHYEVNFFNQRVFQIEIDKKKYFELRGAELSKLATKGVINKHLISIDPRQQAIIEFEGTAHMRSECHSQSNFQIVEETKSFNHSDQDQIMSTND